MSFRFAFVAIMLMEAMTLQPIYGGLIRHDRELGQYRTAAAKPEYACVGKIHLSDPSKFSTGILVAPRMVLTCEHVARRGALEDQTWTFGREQFRAVRVFHVPEYSKENSVRMHVEGGDLVLIELDRDVANVQPAQRYRKRDETGKAVWIVGHGAIGDGQSGRHEPIVQERLAGQNTLDAIGSESAYSLYSDRTLMFDFDGPGENAPNSLGDTQPTELEYGCMSGDSGGGVFIQVDGDLHLAGVVFGNVDQEREHLDGELHQYGQVGAAVRVSSHNDWIDAVIADPNAFDEDDLQTPRLTFQIIDDSRKPVTEFTVLGATPKAKDLRTVSGSSELTIDELNRSEQRVMVIRDSQNTHGKVVRLDSALLEELDGTIQLLPLATVHAQLFDITGRPLVRESVSLTVVPNQRHLRRLESVKTDGEGHIEFKVPCWSKYLLWYDGNKTAFETTVSVRPGMNYDLGKVRVNTMQMTPREELPNSRSK